MYLISVLSLSCVIFSVTCAPQRYWTSDDVEYSPQPYWLNSRRSAYPPMPVYGSFGDEMTRLLGELQKSLISDRIGPEFPPQGQIPVFGISTSTSDESEESDEGDEPAGPSISISGTGFSTLFRNFGGFDAKNLKNKTTVKTEIIDGHKVTVKESTYVSDQDGVKSVIHLSEVDLADPNESDDKTKTSTPKSNEDESPEDKDEKEGEGKDKEDEHKEKEDEGKEEDNKKSEDQPKGDATPVPSEDEDKTENQTPVVEVSKPTIEEPVSKNDEDNETHKDSEENHVRSNRHPDLEVEEIDTDGDNYYNYKYNTVGKVKEDDSIPLMVLGGDWSDNELDSSLSRRRRHASRVVNHPSAHVPSDDYSWYPWKHAEVSNPQTRHRRDVTGHVLDVSRHRRDAGRVVNLQGDTRVNQILSEKQKSSGLYSIDPDAELLGDNYYEVEGRRPSNQQQVVFYKQRPANYQPQYGDEQVRRPQQQRRPNYQQGQVRAPRYNNIDSGDFQRSLPVNSDDYQRNIPVSSDQYKVTENYQRSLPFSSTVYNDYQQTLPLNAPYNSNAPYNRNFGPEGNYREGLPLNPARGDLISPEADDYQRALPVASADFQVDNTNNILPVDYQRQQVING